MLRSDKSISDETVDFFEKLSKRNYRIIIATARPPRAVYNFLPNEFAKHEIIFYNGALIKANDNVLFEECISAELLHSTIKLLNSSNSDILFGCETNDMLFTNGSFEHHWDSSFYSIFNFKNNSINSVHKILVDLPNDEITGFIKQNLSEHLNLVITDGGTLGQIMSKSCSKLNALKQLIVDENELLNQTLCFGDDYNDLEMLCHRRFSVAMENADEKIKKSAKYTAPSNDEEGVLRFLKIYF